MTYPDNDDYEAQATAFAIELLMPEFMLRKDMEGRRLDVEGDLYVKHLADRYGVSAQLMTVRLCQLGYLAR